MEGKEYDRAIYFSNKLMAVKKDEKWGFINPSTGEQIKDFIYTYVYDYKDGLIEVQRGGKKGLLDITGKEIVPCIYGLIFIRSKDGLIEVHRGGKEGLLDITGKEIVPCIYDEVGACYEGYITLEKDGEEEEYIKKDGTKYSGEAAKEIKKFIEDIKEKERKRVRIIYRDCVDEELRRRY